MELEKEMSSLSESAGLFEVNVPDFKQLKQCRKQLFYAAFFLFF
jgi:dynein heavy chain